jgi:gamma-glutamylcyclotransferase (GGCT)/AIG2-like uncharacterized protein YtfP
VSNFNNLNAGLIPWLLPPDFNLPSHPEILPLFVYGSLRPTGSAFGLIKDLVVTHLPTMAVKGELYYSLDREYPVLRIPTSNSNSIVVGDVLFVKTVNKLWEVLCEFELGYGYSLTWVDLLNTSAGTEHLTDSSTFLGKVLVCSWDWDSGFREKIQSGDWFTK